MQPWCVDLIGLYAPVIINSIENKETPDFICQKVGLCTNPQCHLFPLRKRASVDTHVEADPVAQKLLKDLMLNLHNRPPRPEVKVAPRTSDDLPVANHRPLVDWDGDGFSTIFPLRGTAWRGKDCNDFDNTIHPGRKAVIPGDRASVDYNCNGINGTDPVSGQSWEQVLCSGTKQYGIAVLGDSVSAHFHIPPQWVTPADINGSTFSNVLSILENELDWPDMSAGTGFHVNEWHGTPGGAVASAYLKNLETNRCSFRDYQNIAVNGARSSSMFSKIVDTFSRNPTTDNPVLLTLALVGNDVCNGHHDFGSMTTPAEMFTNTMNTLNFLDNSRLPPGSKVIMYGLADGRVLYNGLHNRIHPLGSARGDITYSEFYDYLNCMEASPCWGWMNSNATVRNITAEHQRALNEVLANISKTQKFKNFEILYINDPFTAIINKWTSQGGKIYQLIEPVDGFHPSQLANYLLANWAWDYLQVNAPSFVPPKNPNNARIQQLFGNQGGY